MMQNHPLSIFHASVRPESLPGADLSTFEKGTEDDTQRVFQEHFYGDEHEKIVYAKTSMGPREILSVAKATKGIYYWMKEQGVEWEINSDRNPGYEGIPRVEI